MTREQVLAHVAFMAQWDAAYAANALKWYRANLPWMGLIASAAAGTPPHQGTWRDLPVTGRIEREIAVVGNLSRAKRHRYIFN